MIDLVEEPDIKKERKRSRKYTDEELLEYLRNFEKDNGRIPAQLDFNNDPKYPGFNTYVTRFGSWNSAIKIAGLDINDEKMLEYLRNFEKENGRSPTRRDFINNPKYPGFNTYVRHFGSWSKSLKLVGLDIDSIIKKGILKTMQQKGRLFEICILGHFTEESIDVSGDNFMSPVDGICPKGHIYDTKSSAFIDDRYWMFHLDKREGVDFYYLGAFDKNFRKLLYVWRIPGNFIEAQRFYIGTNNNYTYKY